MQYRVIATTEFKAECLALLDVGDCPFHDCTFVGGAAARWGRGI